MVRNSILMFCLCMRLFLSVSYIRISIHSSLYSYNKQITSWLVRSYDFYYSLVVKEKSYALTNHEVISISKIVPPTRINEPMEPILFYSLKIPLTSCVYFYDSQKLNTTNRERKRLKVPMVKIIPSSEQYSNYYSNIICQKH